MNFIPDRMPSAVNPKPAPTRLTQAAYQSKSGGPLDVDKGLYDRIAKASRTATDDFILPIRSGKAWTIKAGDICRISTPEGPQVGDLNLWNAHNPRERMWAARTRQLQRAHVSIYDRLWSNLPYLRPMVTIIGDSLADYGVDSEGGRVYDLLGTRCDPYVNRMLSGMDFDFYCYSNLTRAVMLYGLYESDVHDVLNVFQSTGLNENDQYFMKTCPAIAGSYFEFFAEIDVLCALSTCPGGDLSKPMWGDDVVAGDDPSLQCCRPLKVEVFRPDSAALEGWSSPKLPEYQGMHGLKAVSWK